MPLHRRLVQPLITAALREDIGRGDVTSCAVIPPRARIRAAIVAKASGIVAGTTAAQWAFQTVDRRIRVTIARRDGQRVRTGQTILRLAGSAHSILAAERTAINLLAHLSGVATLTARFVARIRGAPVRLLDTRKTLPGLRRLQKYAVTVGGGHNHRLGLFDAILIKTNHVREVAHEAPGRSVARAIHEAVRRARRRAPTATVEIETTTLSEFRAALAAKPDVIMLDNWPLPAIKRAVALRNAAGITPRLEASGNVTLTNVRAIAHAGVEAISIGQLTHSAPALDVSLRVF